MLTYQEVKLFFVSGNNFPLSLCIFSQVLEFRRQQSTGYNLFGDDVKNEWHRITESINYCLNE